jgi:very-short-patch-repair endonuclease
MPNLRARELRNSMTPQEVKLWLQLKHFNARGFHFRRQVPIGLYIVDFAEKSARLVIEVDGSQHGMAKGQLRDASRDIFLESLGFRVLRFWNIDIDQAMDGVIDKLNAVLVPQTPPAALRAAPSPLREEG